ncbi:hypothetical protein PENSPDRAFT_657112 [Peniophora sp. CONT]|nr:hypothetical protein PENSPDRAFT_657112 [Peniophora sp. CONT]
MPSQTSHHPTTCWTTAFRERLEKLPQDADTLVAELHEAYGAYSDFCAAVNSRVENLRRPKLLPSRTVSASSLPADILLLIFSIFSEQEPLGDLCEWRGIRAGDSDSDSESCAEADDSHHITPSCPQWCDCWLVPGLEWTRVTHVCSHWRRVALENAILWTTIPFSLCTPWLHELLLRSRSLSLDVNIPCDANWEAIEPILSGCIHRVRSITAERGSAVISNILSRFPAPLLQSLDIDHSVDNSHPFTIPAEMHSSLPQLGHLSVPVITLPPDVQHLALLQLTHLAILSVTVVPSTAEFRRLLQGLERIQFLQLEDCFPVGSDDISAQPILLPHLETLTLRGRTNTCGAVMRSISYNPSTSVTLYMLPDEQPVLDSSEYMQRSGLGALFEIIGPTVFHSLHISCVPLRPNTNTWQLIVTGLRSPCHIDRYVYDDTRVEQHWTGPSHEDLKVVCMLPSILLDGENSTHVLALGLFGHLMATLPLASLTMLSLKVDSLLLRDPNSWNCARWLALLKEADTLEHLQLISPPWQLIGPDHKGKPCPYVDLLLALSLGPHLSQKNILCPDLAELSLVNLDAAATVTIERDGGRFLTATATRIVQFFLSTRSYFEERNLHVAYTGISWQRRFFGEPLSATGPLEKMNGEFWAMKQEAEKEAGMVILSETVAQAFSASTLAL